MEQHEPLFLKVMRLRRPYAEAPSLSLPLPEAAGPEFLDEGPKLILPMALTQSLVGEPFRGYLNLANYSAASVTGVVLRVEIQIGSAKFVLFNNALSPIPSIEPGDFFDTDVDHELRDAGTYVLTCNISYNLPGSTTGEQGSFKRSYRFAVLQPFAIVHRVAQLDTRLFVECSVENATQGSIYLTGAHLDCRDRFRASLLDSHGVPTASGEESEETWLLKPRGAHSLVFIVEPEDDEEDEGEDIQAAPVDAAFVREMEMVGNLKLFWRVPDGRSGAVRGHQIRLKHCSNPALDLRVISCPSRVSVELPFELLLEVVNRSGRPAEPSLIFDLRAMGDVKVHGSMQRPLGRLAPASSARVGLKLLAAAPGVHSLLGLALLDELTHARCEFGPLCDILAF